MLHTLNQNPLQFYQLIAKHLTAMSSLPILMTESQKRLIFSIHLNSENEQLIFKRFQIRERRFFNEHCTLIALPSHLRNQGVERAIAIRLSTACLRGGQASPNHIKYEALLEVVMRTQ